jgi:GR25 family glycosyltransferase involved in LPS biosynthesis
MNHLAIVIAVDGKPRNAELISDLEAMKVFDQVIILNAITPITLDRNYISTQQKRSSAILSRRISPTEVAIKASHAMAYKLAYDKGYDFLSVFEDDTLITEKRKFIENISTVRNSTKYLIYTYYSPKWSVWRKTPKGIRSIYPPPGAVAYTINRAAMLRAISKVSFGVADWPTWSRKITFYLLENAGVEHLGTYSFNSDPNSYHKNNKLTIGAKLRNLVVNFSYNSIYFSIFVPLTWKLAIVASKFTDKSRKQKELKIIF